MVVTRPNHDVMMQYLYAWSSDVITEAKKHSVTVIDLSGKRATRNEFTSVVTKIHPSLIMVKRSWK